MAKIINKTNNETFSMFVFTFYNVINNLKVFDIRQRCKCKGGKLSAVLEYVFYLSWRIYSVSWRERKRKKDGGISALSCTVTRLLRPLDTSTEKQKKALELIKTTIKWLLRGILQFMGHISSGPRCVIDLLHLQLCTFQPQG